MADVKFIDNSIQVKAAMNDATIDWLYEVSNEVGSQAKRNCRTDEEYSAQLAGSYAKPIVNEAKGEAYVGSELEQAFWEEFGTGEHADTAKNGGKEGRKDWWIYMKGESGGSGKESHHYATREEAEQMAAYIQVNYGGTPIVTNGKKPNYTLENAFIAKKSWAEDLLAKKLKEEMGE